MFLGTADEELLPLYVVYAATFFYPERVEKKPQKACYNRTQSG